MSTVTEFSNNTNNNSNSNTTSSSIAQKKKKKKSAGGGGGGGGGGVGSSGGANNNNNSSTSNTVSIANNNNNNNNAGNSNSSNDSVSLLDLRGLASALQLSSQPIIDSSDNSLLDSIHNKLDELQNNFNPNEQSEVNSDDLVLISSKQEEIKKQFSSVPVPNEFIKLFINEFTKNLILTRNYNDLKNRYVRTNNQKNKLQSLGVELQRRVKLIGKSIEKLTVCWWLSN